MFVPITHAGAPANDNAEGHSHGTSTDAAAGTSYEPAMGFLDRHISNLGDPATHYLTTYLPGARMCYPNDKPAGTWGQVKGRRTIRPHRLDRPSSDTGKLSPVALRGTNREVHVADYLRYLASTGQGLRSEVRQPIGAARLTCASTWITTHGSLLRQQFYPLVVGMAWRHVLEDLPTGCARQACCESNYLRYLPSDSINLRSEVRQPIGAARLTRSTASVSIYRAVYNHTLYIGIECAAGNHVLEGLPRWLIGEASRVRHNLGQLTPGYGFAGPEGAIQ